MKDLFMFRGNPESTDFKTRVGHRATFKNFVSWFLVLEPIIEMRFLDQTWEELQDCQFIKIITSITKKEVNSRADIEFFLEAMEQILSTGYPVESVAREIIKSMEDETTPFLFIKGSKKNARILNYLGISL